MAETPRGVRIEQTLWDDAEAALKSLNAPVRVTVTVRPRDTRSGVITATLRALLDATEPTE